jgi:hypothetical protein
MANKLIDTTRLQEFWNGIKAKFATQDDLGDITTLTTTDTSSLVAAINELNQTISKVSTTDDVIVYDTTLINGWEGSISCKVFTKFGIVFLNGYITGGTNVIVGTAYSNRYTSIQNKAFITTKDASSIICYDKTNNKVVPAHWYTINNQYYLQVESTNTEYHFNAAYSLQGVYDTV